MRTVEDRLNNALDAALEMTFPASDPIAVYIAEPRSEIQKLSPDTIRTKESRVRPAASMRRKRKGETELLYPGCR